MATDVTTLEQIYHMITPADLAGAQKLALGQKIEVNYVKELLDAIYNIGSSGALSMDQLGAKLNSLTTNVTDPALLDQVKQIIRFYSSTGSSVSSLGTAQYMATDTDGKTPISKVDFSQICGTNNNPQAVTPVPKTMGIILSNSGYISPAVRNAERVELFMNFLPSIIASRMVPFLEVEFAFNRGIPTTSSGVTTPKLWEPGLLKFLLGGDQSMTADLSTGTGKMLSLQETEDSEQKGVVPIHSVAGMEMFTAPQTLVNPTPATAGARYVDVLDPFRPFLSIESFTVNVTPTVGLYSYKKGSLVIKLHDRSRLSEISDLLRPQIYQDRLSAPTIWITYGWRHPAEPGNPYADFINGNMLVREAYGIINSSFAFDQVGQVTITVELWTKGLAELRTLRANDDADKPLAAFAQLRELAEIIQHNALAQSIVQAEGIHKEIRSQLLIEAAERGAFPDMSNADIKSALDTLKKGLMAKDAKVDKAAAASLISALDSFYKSSDKTNLDFKDQISKQATQATANQFAEVIQGADPFLPSSAQDAANASDSKGPPHPATSMVEAINIYKGDSSDVKAFTSPVKGLTDGFKKKVASFGKLVTVFLAQTLKSMDQIEEMQLFFYAFNDSAGLAANTNIASFPIEMPVFLDQYREHVERRGTERLTVEEFLKLAIDAQLSDTRAIGYGFHSFFAPYDPANKYDAKLQTGSEQNYENALAGFTAGQGPFKKPVVEIYVETVYESTELTSDLDLLHQFESVEPQAGVANAGRAGHYRRIMRIHIFDKANNPYKLAGVILRGDKNTDPAFLEVPEKTAANAAVYQDLLNSVIALAKGSVTSDIKIDNTASGAVSNEGIKHFVSKMVPTLIFGGNASSIISANLASKQDPLLSTTQMLALKSGKPQALQPNGSGVGGLPLRVIPASMTMTTLGCPLLNFGQLFFVDFNTGTTIDNIYGLTGITHTISPGKFESNLTLTFYDAYGKYEGAPTIIEYTKQVLQKATAG